MTPAAITLAARAKINIVLRVGARGADGYHDIETLFQRIDLADDITVGVANEPNTLDVRWESARASDLGTAEQNLAWRAAVAYRDATAWPHHWQIRIVKRIPAGAGLGGGSADAAAVLCALDQLAPEPIGPQSIHALASTLGADVPFLASRVSLAIGRGRGNQLRPLSPLPPAEVALVIPPFATNTAEAYAALDALRLKQQSRPEAAESAPALRDAALASWASVAAGQRNDFEGPVFAQHPNLAAAREWLEERGAMIARLSGSGSTVFGLWEGPLPAGLAAPGPGWQVVRARTT